MKRLALLYFSLLPMLGVAQDGERVLKSCASLLAMNRSAQSVLLFAPKRRSAQLDTVSASAQRYRSQAFHYIWQQEYEQAVAWMEKTTVLYPKEHGMVGEIYLTNLLDYPRALTHFDAYDALTPNFDDMVGYNPVSYMRGLVYRGLGDHQRAIKQFSKAIDSLAHKHGDKWVNYKHFISRAVSYIATGQSEKALVDLDKALKNFNRSALAQYYRGRALLQLNRLAEARTAFQDASFFLKVLRVERSGGYLEDMVNPVYEPEIDNVLDQLKNQLH